MEDINKVDITDQEAADFFDMNIEDMKFLEDKVGLPMRITAVIGMKYNHEESAEDIFKVIRETMGKYVEIKIRYEEDFNAYFFDIMIDEDDFYEYYDCLSAFDEIFRYSLYKGKKIIVTFE